MRKFVALLPWNLYLMLSAAKAVSEGISHPVFRFPLLGPACTVTGPLAVGLYGSMICLLLFCAWASYRILFSRSPHALADVVPNYLIFLGCRYVIPIVVLMFISPAENVIFRQPFLDNTIFWMTFAYFLMTDTVIFWCRFQPEDKVCVRIFGFRFDVQVKYAFWFSILVQTVYVAGELNKHTLPGNGRGKTETVRKE